MTGVVSDLRNGVARTGIPGLAESVSQLLPTAAVSRGRPHPRAGAWEGVSPLGFPQDLRAGGEGSPPSSCMLASQDTRTPASENSQEAGSGFLALVSQLEGQAIGRSVTGPAPTLLERLDHGVQQTQASEGHLLE